MNTDKPILTLIDEYLDNQDISETARKRYRENLNVFVGWLTRHCEDMRNPKRAEIIRYKQSLIDSKKSVTTIDAYLVPVRRFFRYLEEVSIYDNIAVGVTSPRRYPSVRKEYLEVEQVHRLLTVIDRSTITGKRNYAIINLMVNTGMRCVEVSRMDINDIVPTKTGYRIAIQGKGHINKDRSVHIHDEIMDPIHDYVLKRTEKDPAVFINHSHYSHGKRFTALSISKIVKHYLRSIEIDSEKITAHSLRHTAAINAIKAGANIVDVQSMLGHASSKTTDIYLKALEAESREEGTAIRLLGDFYKKGQKNKKKGKKGRKKGTNGNLCL